MLGLIHEVEDKLAEMEFLLGEIKIRVVAETPKDWMASQVTDLGNAAGQVEDLTIRMEGKLRRR